MSWARAVITLVIIIGFIGYAYYAAVVTSQKLYERGLLKEPPVPTIDAKAVATQVAQYTAVAITLLAIAIVAKRAVESTKVLGVIKVSDLQRHLLLLGPTGSGKTNTAKQAIALAVRRGVRVIVIDWKGEYTHFVKGATVIRKVNPWDNGGYTARQRAVIAVEMLREITRDIADVSSASSAVLLRELIKLYEKGVPKSSDVVNRLEEFFRTAMMERRLAEANMAAALLRRLQWLVIDEERSVVNLRGSEQVIIYDLSQLGSSYLKTMYAIAVLSKTYYEAMNGLTNSLTTLLVAEEAQNYIRARRPEDPPSTGERVVNELRAYGVGAVIVSPDLEQLPWHIAKDVGAVVSIGAESMPYTVKDNALRTIDPRHTRRLLTGRKVYIHYNGRLKIVSPPKPPRPIDLKVATVVEETESKEKQPEQADENVQATIEQKVTTESSEESLEEGPKPPLRLEEDEEPETEEEQPETEELEAEAPQAEPPTPQQTAEAVPEESAEGFPLHGHIVVEEEGTLRCVRCRASVSLTEAPTLAEMRCSNDDSKNNEVLKCQACRRPATQKLPLINFKGEFEDFNACDACSNDYLRLLRQGPSLGHGKGRLPPDSYYFDSLRTVFQRLGGVFPCPACEEFYEDLYGVVQHFSQKHRELLQEPKDDEIEGVPAVKTWQFLWCKKCLKYFENERHFRSHIQFCKGDRK